MKSKNIRKKGKVSQKRESLTYSRPLLPYPVTDVTYVVKKSAIQGNAYFARLNSAPVPQEDLIMAAHATNKK